MRLAREIVSQSAMDDWRGDELAPGPDAQSDDELLDYIHKTHNTVYHPSCTVRMGAADDPDAPLDPRLRVKGVARAAGLRRVDHAAAGRPEPVITTTMIGEKCADMVKEDAGKRAEAAAS